MVDVWKYLIMLVKALDGTPKDEILFGDGDVDLSPRIQAIADGTYASKTDAEIKGRGYVVDSLEAALWCFHRTANFRDAILKAVNLGDDADTTAAVCGQIAGAYYGESGIPAAWLEKLCMRDMITEFADKLQRGTA